MSIIKCFKNYKPDETLFIILGCNANINLTFQRYMLPPSSGSKSKPARKQ
jgi:hypothetical protein